MLRSLVLVTTAFALAASPLAAAEKAQVSLAKTSKWEMQYNDDSCSLLANFGEGDNKVLMVLTRTAPTDWFEMKLYGKMLRQRGIRMPIEVAFGNQAAVKTEGMSATATSSKEGEKARMPTAIIPWLRVDGWSYPAKPTSETAPPAISPKQEEAVTSVSFKIPGSKQYQLLTGSLGAPLVAMRACTDNLLRFWGYDPAIQAALSRPAIPTASPGSWLGTSDFPRKATFLGLNSFVRFRLDVDEAGGVTGCRVLYRTNPDEFADLSCKLITKRAKFSPALDANGKAVKTFYINQIRWQSGEW